MNFVINKHCLQNILTSHLKHAEHWLWNLLKSCYCTYSKRVQFLEITIKITLFLTSKVSCVIFFVFLSKGHVNAKDSMMHFLQNRWPQSMFLNIAYQKEQNELYKMLHIHVLPIENIIRKGYLLFRLFYKIVRRQQFKWYNLSKTKNDINL